MPQTNTPNNQSSIQSFLGHAPQLGASVYVHNSATVIGSGSNIQDCAVLHVNHKSTEDPAGSPLMIGNNVTIGHTVILHGCTIEDECLIGMGSIVMDKAVVQKHVLVAAGSLVPEGKILESGFLYMGSPVKKARALTADEIAFFMVSANGYIQLKDEYLST